MVSQVTNIAVRIANFLRQTTVVLLFEKGSNLEKVHSVRSDEYLGRPTPGTQLSYGNITDSCLVVRGWSSQQ